VKRREFITLLGGTAAWPLAGRAERAGRVFRIGYLSFMSAAQHPRSFAAFREGLRTLGYIEGENLQIEFRSADGDNDLLPHLATELVHLNVDLIVTYATGVPAARRATTTIPIVMATYTDAPRIVANLANPGGNVTGSTFFHPELMGKRLELLKEVAPSTSRAGVFLFRGSEGNGSIVEVLETTAKALSIELQLIEVERPTDLEGAFSALTNQQIGALVIGDHALFIANADVIAALAAKHGLPSIGHLDLPAKGGLMAYGVNFPDQFRRAAVFVDKILRGAKPGDIPVERPTKFMMTVNAKTAKALGIELPTSILLRADEVIE
jgi:putative ABC transport system substrate-binding protein